MAKPSPDPKPTFLVLFTLTLCIALASTKPRKFSATTSPSSLGLTEEKLTHIKFYFHDIVSGRNPTAVRVAEADVTNASRTLFGDVMVMDDPLTILPDPASETVGYAQGMYVSASRTELSLLMVLNFAFKGGDFNGSSLSVLGRNAVFSGVREMPIVGGNGAFRFARGYAQAKTYSFDLKTGDAVVEYDVYVMHY
ncbi:PREDICTED: dirigent protein 22-like [Tarenaya hassleriana]|uniref:dirigent protein 22-like n=1 Tax=Tarenaya hassleriana TaxID=28532 RepID=UPI0008FD0346|nr:PREDICTED: dirigent protein 22-like [Tarenaya hassleriana]